MPAFDRTSISLLALAAFALLSAQTKQNPDDGFTDTPMLPGLPWHVHDPARPHPPLVTPAATAGGAPSDAIVLFDGKDLSQWQDHASTISKAGDSGAPAKWNVADGYVEAVPRTGDLATKE